jgi:hypothetical protein
MAELRLTREEIAELYSSVSRSTNMES